ncbi:hypothetical protein NQ176_g4346 [Zarea fungicola]|uniref:Uncharacterized protein n=1 Tax=Zarea fungicola TaxID=93591 RepID=A0ACC1NGI9_9HYPO|nr:hypothetical protein NQ176_g4346 [Lecanicillium fungicola]
MANQNPPPDERVVYLALKNIFKGQNAQARKSKTVSKLIRQHKTQESVANLLREHNFDIICNLAVNLLSAEIFESTLKAKVRFPELFDASPTQSAEKEASEAEATRYEADAIKNAIQSAPNVFPPIAELQLVEKSSDPENDGPAAAQEVKEPHASKQANPFRQTASQVTSIFPVYLPHATEHRLFVRIQNMLEQVCYEYGSHKMPDVLQRHVIVQQEPRRRRSLRELFASIANIRHTAVHRLRVHAKGVDKYLNDAERFTILLGNKEQLQAISKLRRDTRTALDELERNKHLLRAKLDDTRQKISEQRKMLDAAEKMAIAEMETEDEQYQLLAGKCVDAALTPSEDSFSTAIDEGKNEGTVYDDTDSTNEYDKNDKSQEGWVINGEDQ